MASTGATPPIETTAQFKGPQGEALRWLTEIKLYETETKAINERCEKIVKRYRNGSVKDLGAYNESALGRRFSLFWSNVQTLQPTIFAKPPKANVSRRFKDKDPVGRVAAEIAERVLDFFIDKEAYVQAIKNARDDYLIVGQGVHWHRYVPHFKDVEYRDYLPEVQDEGLQVTDTAEGYDADGEQGGSSDVNTAQGETGDNRSGGVDAGEILSDERGRYTVRTEQEIDYEETVTDYVHWRDFGRSPGARTWAEVYCVWRKTYLTRDENIARFGEEIGSRIELDYAPPKDDSKGTDKQFYRKATIYEIADKSSGKFIWVAKSFDGDVLDERDDPLRVGDFFPCQMPLFANLTTNSLEQVPDYLQYQDQADEMDTLTEKIYTIMDAIRIRGLYAGNLPELSKLLQDSSDNDFTPVDMSIMAMMNGDISKSVWVWPIETLVAALNELIAARERVKQDSYEITGISDIVRGASDPRETLGAQQIKTQTGSIRIRDRQADMARFIRDGLRIDFDIVVNHFQPETIARIADVKSLPDGHFVQGPNGEWVDPVTLAPSPGASQPPMPGAPPPGQAPGPVSPSPAPVQAAPPAPMPPAGMPPAQMGLPMPPTGPTLAEAAIALLKDAEQRPFRIDIETDSTIEPDQAQMQQERTELLTAISAFATAWFPVLQAMPSMAKLVGELLMFALRGFKAASSLEGVIESTMEDLVRASQAPQQPPPDPAMEKVKAESAARQQELQINAQIEQAKLQMQGANDQQRLALEREIAQMQLQLEQTKAAGSMQLEQHKTQATLELQAHKQQSETMLKAQANSGDDILRQVQQIVDKAEVKIEGIAAKVQQTDSKEGGEPKADAVAQIGQMHADMLAQIGELTKALAAPREIVRGADGRATGVRPMANGAMQ